MAKRAIQVGLGSLVGLVVGGGALALALRDADMGEIGAAFARAGWLTVVLGAGVHVLVQLVYAARWRLLLGSSMGLTRLFGIVAIGYLANYALPGRPGELVRAALLRGLGGVPLALGLASLVIEKVLDGGTILLSAGAFVVGGPEWLRGAVAIGGAVLILAIAGFVIAALVVKDSGAPAPAPPWASAWTASPGSFLARGKPLAAPSGASPLDPGDDAAGSPGTDRAAEAVAEAPAGTPHVDLGAAARAGDAPVGTSAGAAESAGTDRTGESFAGVLAGAPHVDPGAGAAESAGAGRGGGGWVGRLVGFGMRRLVEIAAPARALGEPGRLVPVVGLGLVSWVLILLHQAILCQGVGTGTGPASWLLLYAALGLASVVPGAPGYVGTYQLAAVLSLSAFGVEREPAFVVATLYQLSRLLGALAVSIWAIAREDVGALRRAL